MADGHRDVRKESTCRAIRSGDRKSATHGLRLLREVSDDPTAGANSRRSLRGLNQGVAPFYREWALELGLLDSDGKVLHRWPVDWVLTGLLPGSDAREWKAVVNLPNDVNSKDAVIALRVINPLANGKPLRFANESQDRHAPGWLTLGAIQPE